MGSHQKDIFKILCFEGNGFITIYLECSETPFLFTFSNYNSKIKFCLHEPLGKLVSQKGRSHYLKLKADIFIT
jgi:hypothetical protein